MRFLLFLNTSHSSILGLSSLTLNAYYNITNKASSVQTWLSCFDRSSLDNNYPSSRHRLSRRHFSMCPRQRYLYRIICYNLLLYRLLACRRTRSMCRRLRFAYFHISAASISIRIVSKYFCCCYFAIVLIFLFYL